jgi:hypothetical protein
MSQPTAKAARKTPLPTMINNGQVVVSDNSNTQFAMMAAWIARRYKIPGTMVPIPVYKSMALMDQHFRSTQHPDGGWNYHFQKPSTHTMTCAGLIGLGLGVISHMESLGPVAKNANVKHPKDDKDIQDGLAYIGKHISVAPADWSQKVNPENLYFVWSVERVAMLYNLKTVGGKEWYPWAAHNLVVNQDANGSWVHGGYIDQNPVINTCLALLVLKRVNLVQQDLNIPGIDAPIVEGNKK